MQPQFSYIKSEEAFNSVSHGIGVLLANAGCAIMLYTSSGTAAIISAAVYGLSTIFMYAMSTIYHAVDFPKGKTPVADF